MMNRRQFLKGLVAAGGYLAFSGLLPDLAPAGGKTFSPGLWRGHASALCHDLVRDRGTIPPVVPDRRVEVCIVGGGLSGLAAAYRLRHTSLLLLEHLGRIGGHAVRDRWNGIWFSGAAAYFMEPEPPLDRLYAELKLPMRKIQEPTDGAILHYNPVIDPFGSGLQRLPYPAAVRRDFARAKRDFLEILRSDDFPVMPIHRATEASKRYDRASFADWLLREKRYHPAVKAYIDLYCRSAFGAPSEEVSAFAGLNFYAGEFGDRYTFPGGNGLAAELLREATDRAGEGRIVAGTTVVSVEEKRDRVIVIYIDWDGEAAAVEAKAAIVAVPKYIARYIVKGLPEEQRDAMGELCYGSYLVANVLCTAPIAGASYDTWTDVAPFTDFIVADWVTREGSPKRGNPPGRKSKRQVLTVYYPIGYQHALLLADDAYDAYRSRIVKHLEVLYPGATSKIEDVLLYRWGHALCHGRPGWYTQKAPVASCPLGRVFFAHSDNQGLPAFESALAEGISAAEQAVSLLSRPKTTRHGDFPGGKNRVPKPMPHRIPLSGLETPIVLGEF